MRLRQAVEGLKIKHKLLTSGILYLVLISIVVYFFISSNNLIRRVSVQQRELNSLSEEIRQTEEAVNDYVNQRMAHDEVVQRFNRLGDRLDVDWLASDLGVIQDQIAQFNTVRSRNQAIEGEIDTLTESSLAASNKVIKEISDRLVGDDTRSGVSNMERAVIVGANMNTNANFRIKVLFGKLKTDMQVKEKLLGFLDTLVANVTKDIELLKGTKNEAAARQAKATNLEVKTLVLEYIDNVNALNGIEKKIFETTTAIDQRINAHVLASSNQLFATIKGYFSTIIAVILLISLMGISVNFLFGKAISGSMDRLIQRVKDLAEGDGDLTKRMNLTSRDEIGELARWIDLFVQKLHSIIREVSGHADMVNSSSSDLTSIAQQMSGGARQASQKSDSVAASSEEMSVTMNSVAAASEQASANVAMVSTATDEMANTVKEIAKRSEKARTVTSDAVNKASGAATNINQLGEAADQISKVTEVITEISEQTNLLALNATIEAARAGEAGKGFAVVANEIKDLAKQTAQATQEIKSRIDGIQHSSSQTVDEIKVISEVIVEVDEIVSAIAAAVEEQAASTRDIAMNVTEASKGISEVNQNVAQSSEVSRQIAEDIAEVNQTARMLADSGAQVNQSSQSLADLAGKLHVAVKRFKL